MTRLYEMLVRVLMLAPYGIHWNKERWINARSAKNTIQLCKYLGVTPKSLMDVGANNSQWAYWIKRKWPGIHITSVEPHPDFNPIGDEKIRDIAFSDNNLDEGQKMTSEGMSSHLDPDGIVPVTVMRADCLFLGLKQKRPSILKVDCETHTYRALSGFGDYLNEFDIIVVEMWNHSPNADLGYQQSDIWKLMLKHGKQTCRIVDCEWTSKNGFAYYDAAFYNTNSFPIN